MFHYREDDAPTPFEYPEEALSPEAREQAKTLGKEYAREALLAFILALTVRLLAAKDPRLDVIALCYLSGFDMVDLLGVAANTQDAIAAKLKISKQGFNQKCIRMAKSLGIDYLRANRGHRIQRKRNKLLTGPKV